MEQKFFVGDRLFVNGDLCFGHGFDEEDYPVNVIVIEYSEESREGDPAEIPCNFQEYYVKDLHGYSQWVAEEDLITPAEAEELYG